MKIFVLGPAGTHSHQAALLAFGLDRAEIQFVDTNRKVLEAVQDQGHLGVVAVENSVGGLVAEVRDFWIESKEDERPVVIGETKLPVLHSLVSYSEECVGEIDTIASHPQALEQCRRGIEIRYPHIKCLMPMRSTAAAAQAIASGSKPPNWAALASSFAAEQYGLHVVERDNMQDFSSNVTRFHVVAHSDAVKAPNKSDPKKAYRTAVLFNLKDETHALMHALWHIKANMSSMHSIPLGEPDKFAFYVEFGEHSATEKGKEIIKGLKAMTSSLIVLGSYPQANQERKS